ncbi:MarR family transcriptional regulator [Marichromatium gracile]|uniref:MarR family winged helix-turn-helix transcriptional regulator n=1 Tax=Marichromatium TaxID=85076 RepID=UPI000F3DC2C6|nr:MULTISPECIES: MarR family transcriptional regulator [Marichromatium]MBO8086949.1 MarR family transcriptional regulator [Marichromatium sp.]MCF1182048.1 MarR family transcriptional regulator [Marichromatium gracile]RNE89044.1 MarR family transcriptional regulator [Marichromatium sp. AB31]RNE92631.1 MarR family transcriptional regulator [Marichromatium sp. AB32]
MDTPAHDSIDALIRHLLRLLNKLDRIEKQPIQVEDGLDLSTKEIHTVEAIGERGTMNVTEVGTHFGITKGAASQRISRLVERGLVAKRAAAHSNKEFELSLTDLGWRAFRAHEHYHGRAKTELIERLAALPREQLDDVTVVLDIMEGVMNERLREQ